MKTSRLLCLFMALLTSGCVKNMADGKENKTPERKQSITQNPSYPCGFAAGNVAGASCNIPFVALLANPEKFDGKRVFTYAYLRKLPSPEKGYTLFLERKLRRAPDFASCVLLSDQVKGDDVSLGDVKNEELYSVALAGTFNRSSNYICAGTLHNIDLQYLSKEPNE